MPIVSQALEALAPWFAWLGQPSASYPYPFVGYRRLPSVGADKVAIPDAAALAADIGGMLDRLHRIDTDCIPPPPVSSEGRPRDSLAGQLTAVPDTIRPLLDDELAERAAPYPRRAGAQPPDDGPRRFIHHDICADHVLVDPDSGRLRGVIDFTDAAVGGPVSDFVGLVGIGDRRFIDQVLAAYDLPLGDKFLDRYRWLTRTLTLTWLGEAATNDPAAVRKHTTWVQRAFDRP